MVINRDARWHHPQVPRNATRGIFLSLVLHLGVAVLAFGLVQVPEGLPPGDVEPIEVEIISADAFDASFAEARAQPPTAELRDRSPDEGQFADIPVSNVPQPIMDPESMPLPEIPPPVTEPELPPEPAPLHMLDVPQSAPTSDDERISTETPVPEKPRRASQNRKAVSEQPRTTKPIRNAHIPGKSTQHRAGQAESGKGFDAASHLSGSGSAKGQGEAAGSGVFSSYKSRVMSHLARYRRYPDAARVQNMRGRVLVTFALDRSGKVIDASLARPSGHVLLDREALAMVRRASPFPPFPPEAGRASASFTAPIHYDMN